MIEGFEKVFSEIQKDMISVCMEYVEDKADTVFLYASYEENAITCDFFYEINEILYRKHELPDGYDTSEDRQFECLDILNEDMFSLISECKKFEADMPTEIKIIYNVNNHKINAKYRYDEVFSKTDKLAEDIAEEWYRDILKEKMEQCD